MTYRRHEDDAPDIADLLEHESALSLHEYERAMFETPSAIDCERSARLALHRNELLFSLNDSAECAVIGTDDRLQLLPYLKASPTLH